MLNEGCNRSAYKKAPKYLFLWSPRRYFPSSKTELFYNCSTRKVTLWQAAILNKTRCLLTVRRRTSSNKRFLLKGHFQILKRGHFFAHPLLYHVNDPSQPWNNQSHERQPASSFFSFWSCLQKKTVFFIFFFKKKKILENYLLSMSLILFVIGLQPLP